jgi:hypothetical protein
MLKPGFFVRGTGGRESDCHPYTVTVEVGGRLHSASLADPVEASNLQKLLTVLQLKAKTLFRRYE